MQSLFVVLLLTVCMACAFAQYGYWGNPGYYGGAYGQGAYGYGSRAFAPYNAAPNGLYGGMYSRYGWGGYGGLGAYWK